MIIERAGRADIRDIVALVNAAYRGMRADRGWTHEAALLEGQRTDASMVEAIVADPSSVLLLLRDSSDRPVIGCVAIEAAERPSHRSIGMLTVDPDRQSGGLGRLLLRAAEDRAREAGAEVAEMTVIGSRALLIDWYARQGYRPTGKTKPFPYGDERFGRPLTDNLHFIVVEKTLLSGVLTRSG